MGRISAWIDFVDPLQTGSSRSLRLAFGEPQRCLVARAPDEVVSVLKQVHEASLLGCWCVGYVRYEAAPAFDAAMSVHAADGPLAWFAVHKTPLPIDDWFRVDPSGDATRAPCTSEPDRMAFDASLEHIQSAIGAGDLYQVNHTAALHGSLQGEAIQWFQRLRRAQPGGYAAYLDDGQEQILSVSPELFFHWDGANLLARPMKGTAARGSNPADDQFLKEALQSSDKDRAENVMIVDLLRNDLSRVALPHTVKVPALFDVRGWPTVWQMTSDVTARTRPGVGLHTIFAALFPCGSVTGAPKLQAMRQIRALEPGPRGVYCGAVGVVQPCGVATFNVAIRTATVRGTSWRCGIGSGITAGSTAEGEWTEWRQKRAFLERAREPFKILETLLLRDGQPQHAELHKARMAQAAKHFGHRWQAQAWHDALQGLAQAHPVGSWRVRLLLEADGRLDAEAIAFQFGSGEVRLQLAARPFAEAASEFTRFKTTRRAHYEAHALQKPDVFDTLLWNAAGELTECTRGNIAVQLDGQWCTPELNCGLLNGVQRQIGLSSGCLVERVIRSEALAQAQGLAFLNSLRGWLPARLSSVEDKADIAEAIAWT